MSVLRPLFNRSLGSGPDWIARVKAIGKEVCTAKAYQDAAFKPVSRSFTLFENDDPLLSKLDAAAHLKRFHKHTPCVGGMKRADFSFAGGEAAARDRGIDFQYYFDTLNGSLKGALRFGAKSLISENDEFVHGGCFGVVMDEATGEMVRVSHQPAICTTSITTVLKRPLLPDITYYVESRIVEIDGPWITAEAAIYSGDFDALGSCHASSSAILFDLTSKI